MHYAIGLQTAFFVTFVAFVPATVVAAKTGIWHAGQRSEQFSESRRRSNLGRYMNVLYTEGSPALR